MQLSRRFVTAVLILAITTSPAFGFTSSKNARADSNQSAEPNQKQRLNHGLWGGLGIVWGIANLGMAAWYYSDFAKCKGCCKRMNPSSKLGDCEELIELDKVERRISFSSVTDQQPLLPPHMTPTSGKKAALIIRRLTGSLILFGDALIMEISSGVVNGIAQLNPNSKSHASSFFAYALSTLSASVITTTILSWFTGLQPTTRLEKSMTYGIIPVTLILSSIGSILWSTAFLDVGEFAKEPKEKP